MQVLVTGAFGNLGVRTVEALIRRGHRVRCFDLPTRRNKLLALKFGNAVDLCWGDITDQQDVEAAVLNQDAVIHDAAILPPAAEKFATLSEKVNLEGTRRLLRAFEAYEPSGPFVYASSITVHGPEREDRDALVGAESPIVATDEYTRHKVECEAMVRDSSAPWIILRIGVALDETSTNTDAVVFRQMFEIDPSSPIHFVHTDDVAVAQANAVSQPKAYGKVLPIGGDESCKIRQQDLMGLMFEMLGIDEFPEEAFGHCPYYTAWMDTRESQELLDFQHHGFPAMRDDVLARYRKVQPLLSGLSPISRRMLLKLSGPYQGDAPRPRWGDFKTLW